jgi:spore coat protein U-like protein
MKRILYAAVLMGFGALPLAAPAQSATITGNLNVTATVNTSCTVTGDTMAFGALAPTVQATGTATITVACQVGSSPKISLSGGNAPYDDATGGLLKSGSNSIVYSLFSTSGRTTPFPDSGDVSGGNPITLDGNGNGSVTIYGKINAGTITSATPVGGYSDTITVNIVY